jgi:hypothetical protein
MTTYFEMIDAVNDATTALERSYAEARLSGWIDCAKRHGVHWSGTDADIYSMRKHGDVPMCCGVLMTLNVI